MTDEMVDDRLLTRFDFDEVWGTALNKFLRPGSHRPLVHALWKGGLDSGVSGLEGQYAVSNHGGRESSR